MIRKIFKVIINFMVSTFLTHKIYLTHNYIVMNQIKNKNKTLCFIEKHKCISATPINIQLTSCCVQVKHCSIS